MIPNCEMDFSFIPDGTTRACISNGYEAMDQLELWDWLKSFEPAENEGFMWSSDPNVQKIGNKMESLTSSTGHSGMSFAITMRHLHYIAKNGLDSYKIFVTTQQ